MFDGKGKLLLDNDLCADDEFTKKEIVLGEDERWIGLRAKVDPAEPCGFYYDP